MKKRNRWGFQLLPCTPDVLGKGYRVDPVTQAIEDDVDNALPYHFRFHKISKLVIRLGNDDRYDDYFESHGVAQKYFTAFDVHQYAQLPDEEKAVQMRSIVLEVFDWLEDRFDDAQCFREAREKLGWA